AIASMSQRLEALVVVDDGTLNDGHKGEGVSTAQLMLLLEGLGHTAPQPGDEPQSELVSCSAGLSVFSSRGMRMRPRPLPSRNGWDGFELVVNERQSCQAKQTSLLRLRVDVAFQTRDQLGYTLRGRGDESRLVRILRATDEVLH